MNEEAIAARLAASRKYGNLAPATLRRVATWAASRSRGEREAEERARKKLHQVYGAFLEGFEIRRAEKILDGCAPAERAEACRRILAMHASTRERAPFVERFYAEVFALTGPPRALLDLGCGLGALALPWMELPEACAWSGWDLDRRHVALVNRALEAFGRPPLAACRDLLVEAPPPGLDVVLLLKLLPSLEQQEPGSASRILGALDARCIVASFPARTLGGRSRGMPATYDALAAELGRALGCESQRLAFPNEIVHVWIRGPRTILDA